MSRAKEREEEALCRMYIGDIKARFLILKHAIRFHDEQQIERMFATCAVLHNKLLEYDGLDEVDEDFSYNVLDRISETAASRSNTVSGVRSSNREMYGVPIVSDDEDDL